MRVTEGVAASLKLALVLRQHINSLVTRTPPVASRASPLAEGAFQIPASSCARISFLCVILSEQFLIASRTFARCGVQQTSKSARRSRSGIYNEISLSFLNIMLLLFSKKTARPASRSLRRVAPRFASFVSLTCANFDFTSLRSG